MGRIPQKPTDPEVEHYLSGVGKRVKATRELHGLSQIESARLAGIPIGSLRDIEQGYDTRISYHHLNAEHLELPFGYGFSEGLTTEVRDLAYEHGAGFKEKVRGLRGRIEQLSERTGHLEEAMHVQTRRMTRRTFNASPWALLGTVFPAPVRGLLAEPGFPPLSEGDVEVIHACCDDLDAQYRAQGGGAVFDLTVALHNRALAWFREGAYPEHVRRALGMLCAQLKSWAGWFAYDTEQLALAERFLHEAITYARVTRSPQVEIHALDNLCALFLRTGHHGQALHVAEVGLAVTPAEACRTRSVFHMRRLAACAHLGDEDGFFREAEAGQNELEHGPGPGDQPWSNWAKGDIMLGRLGRAFVDLGQGDKAEELLHLSNPHYRHNDLLDEVYLCHALVQQGALSQASDRAAAILTDVMTFESGRIHRKFHQLYGLLSRQRADPRVREFVYAYDEMIARDT